MERYTRMYDIRYMCCGVAPCKIIIPQQYPNYNDSDGNFTMYVDSDLEEEFEKGSYSFSPEKFGDVFAKESHSDSPEKFVDDFTKDAIEEFDKHFDIDQHSIDLANDFAKHFDSHSAVGVKSNLVQTRMGEWTSLGNDKFYNSNSIPASPWLAAIAFFIV